MVEVAPIDESRYDEVLPLVAAYQRFYAVEPEPARNAAFLHRFLAPDGPGLLLGAVEAGRLVGYACVHWRLDTVEAREVACLHDLFVSPDARGRGVGRMLLSAAADAGRARGSAALVWSTAPDNATAQRLYDRTGATRSTWVEYDLPLAT